LDMAGDPGVTAPVFSFDGGLLLERERELAALKGLVVQAAEGVPNVAVIEGPPGIGKTRLIGEARRLAADAGLLVCAARGSELEREFAFGVVCQLFERVVADGRKGALVGAASPARAIVAGGEDGERLAPGADPSFAFLHALYWLTVHISEERPLFFAVDDLHWCDAASLRFLAYLRPRLEGLPVLLVCSTRSSQDDHASLVSSVVSQGVPMRPGDLSEGATAELVQARLGVAPEAAFVAACQRATGGNPLLLSELLKTLAVEAVRPDAAHLRLVEDLGARAVSRTVLLRLGRLSAEARMVAQVVAVLGDGAELRIVSALAGLGEEQAATALASLARAEILRAEPPLGFAHPLIAATVYRDLLAGERQLRHRHAAELLAAAGAPVEQVAGHLLLAPEREEQWSAAVLTDAGEAALRKGAADSAVAYLSRALREQPRREQRSELVFELGQAEALLSLPGSLEHLQQAYETLADPERRADAAGLLARALLFAGFPEESAALARRAAAELPEGLVDLRERLVAFELFCALFGVGGPDALARLERYRTRPVGAGIGAKMLAAIAAQGWMYACGPSDAVSELSLAALAGGELITADNGLRATCAITNLTYADREEAEHFWELARADAHRRGSLVAISAMGLWRGHTLYWRGELTDAQALLEGVVDELGKWGYGELQAQIYADAHLSAVLRERGDLAGARRALQRSSDPGGSDDGARYWLNANVEQLLAERRFEPALAAAEAYARRFDHIVPNPMDAPWRSHKAIALEHFGRREEARELLEEELALARRWGAPGTIARTLRALGALKRRDGLEELQEAVEVVEGSPARLEHAKSLVALGTALRGADRPAEARKPLRKALELTAACGAGQLLERARGELYAAGSRPRATALAGVASLTASERRVATLAAEGHTNRQVAEALFVTPKTVEMHLGNVFRKLGVSSRRELPKVLER